MSSADNVADVRRKRLIALGVIQDEGVASASLKKKSSIEVIDLIDDSEDEDAVIAASQARRHPSARRPSSSSSKPTSKRPKPNPSSSSDPTAFKVATWNVWFGDGDGQPNPAARMRALCQQLKASSVSSSPLWFIGFQEVVDSLWNPHITSELSSTYQLYRQKNGCPYGCALAVHKSLTVLDQGFVEYPNSKMGRGILYVRVRLPFSGRSVLFTTTHLESFNGKNDPGGPQRAAQCRAIRDFCATSANGATRVITGDMNWDDYLAPRSRRQLQDSATMRSIFMENQQCGWHDTWLDLNEENDDPGYTYDPKENPMLGGGNLRRRFDRCIADASATCTNAQLLGKEAIGDLTYEKYNPFNQKTTTRPVAPSDHFGYIVTLRVGDSSN